MTSPSFLKLATVTAITKRTPAMSGGKVAEPIVHVPQVRCTPIDPLTPEVATRLGLEAPYTGFQTFAAGEALDIAAGDFLVANGRTYGIRAAGLWDWKPGEQYVALVLEHVKGAYGSQ
jgi:hypothetical protein